VACEERFRRVARAFAVLHRSRPPAARPCYRGCGLPGGSHPEDCGGGPHYYKGRGGRDGHRFRRRPALPRSCPSAPHHRHRAGFAGKVAARSRQEGRSDPRFGEASRSVGPERVRAARATQHGGRIVESRTGVGGSAAHALGLLVLRAHRMCCALVDAALGDGGTLVPLRGGSGGGGGETPTAPRAGAPPC